MKWWGKNVQVCLDILDKSTPKQWLLPPDKLPHGDQPHVVDVPRHSGALTDEEVVITDADVAVLLAAYQSGQWTVRQVVTAFLKKAVVMNQLTNFVTEFLTDDAFARADELDAHRAATGHLVGPLHGIPVSVKEHIGLAHRITHAGFVSFIASRPPPTEDAHLVQLLRRAGAVVHVRTNQPQSLMHLDCANNITGATRNPWDRRLSPGGSSGGEGVAVGAGCSVLGVGTDIGGSIRAPAAFGNCYGLRPTALRVPTLGQVGLTAGQESIRGVAGPLAGSVEGLEVFMRSVLAQEPWEHETTLVPVPWRTGVEFHHDFTVGLMLDDGIVKPHPPVIRALKTAAEQLRRVGVKVVDWEPFDHQRGWDIVAPLYFPDGGQVYLDEFAKSGEPVLPLTHHAFDFARRAAQRRGLALPLSVHDNWALNQEREAYRREHHARMRARGVDFILCPAYVGAAPPQGAAKYWHYTAVWNVLDLPAAVLPSGLRCDRRVDVREEGRTPRNAMDKEESKAYNAELYHNFPISLQLVGKRFMDEEVLAALKVLDRALKGVS